MSRQLGAIHYAANSRYELQRTFNFEVVISGLPEDVTLNVVSFPLPQLSNPGIAVSYGNSKMYIPGQAEYQQGEFVVNDAIGADIERLLNDWRRDVYDEETDEIGLFDNYAKQGMIYHWAPNGTMVRKWKLLYVWPEEVNYGALSNETSDKKTISMTLRYVKAVRQ